MILVSFSGLQQKKVSGGGGGMGNGTGLAVLVVTMLNYGAVAKMDPSWMHLSCSCSTRICCYNASSRPFCYVLLRLNVWPEFKNASRPLQGIEMTEFKIKSERLKGTIDFLRQQDPTGPWRDLITSFICRNEAHHDHPSLKSSRKRLHPIPPPLTALNH